LAITDGDEKVDPRSGDGVKLAVINALNVQSHEKEIDLEEA